MVIRQNKQQLYAGMETVQKGEKNSIIVVEMIYTNFPQF